MSLAKKVSYAVLCLNPKCEKRTPKTLAWLTVHNVMTCEHCGKSINLQSGKVAVVIQKLAQECARLDTQFTNDAEAV